VSRADGGARVTIGAAMFELADDAAARAHVALRGAGPMSLVLRGPVARPLDRKLAHGAALSIAP
jgi:hypothetical protein